MTKLAGMMYDFCSRHLGSNDSEQKLMLEVVGADDLDTLSSTAIPENIQFRGRLNLPAALSEVDALDELRQRLSRNKPKKTFMGLGYAPALLPLAIQRNVLENPGWYTQYTPYQAEIAQGRLEALLNFQTLISSLTGLPLANASLLDEATAAAEAMVMCKYTGRPATNRFVVSPHCHPQTIAVVRTRARALGIEVIVADPSTYDFAKEQPFGVLDQYPASLGTLSDPRAYLARAKAAKTSVILSTCPLALCLLESPAVLGADIAVGSTQRLGLPLGFGGPHAAFLAAREEFRRTLPGRIVGISKDAAGRPAYRLALQTREQHIRRERATSNICTAQVLPAVIASFYAVYHGPDGMTQIATHIARHTATLHHGLTELGFAPANTKAFDTLYVPLGSADRARVLKAAESANIELCAISEQGVAITLGEPHQLADIVELLQLFAGPSRSVEVLELSAHTLIPSELRRTTAILEHRVFNRYHTEHELLRYMRRLESRDLSLTTSMIPLGSCTMKLNATAEMVPVTWPEASAIHPFTHGSNVEGSLAIAGELSDYLAEITGMDAVCLQPNSGAQGEYAGLLTIRNYYESKGEPGRNICLIPVSAHGTNPASAVLAGLTVVVVACDAQGNVDVADLKAKADKHRNSLAALMITYPSTHGVFERNIREICEVVHAAGGQVYLDGANMNAQVGLCRPGDYGADVCHLNLHKTFCIPHGGGGPGMGPIAVRAHLASHLPTHPFSGVAASEANGTQDQPFGAVSAAPLGSGSVLPISWMYIRMMGPDGLRKATQVALLNANYMASRLSSAYSILYRGEGGYCAHEFIVDARGFKKSAQIEVDDIAKRLMDYGYHAPTMSFPVPGTLMIEPTESESLAELDRFCDAMLKIRQEIAEIEAGRVDATDNALKFAPHTAQAVTADAWPHGYSREQAAYPDDFSRMHKFWPYVGRIDNATGDRNLICTCAPTDSY